jgi:hypothetical protein
MKTKERNKLENFLRNSLIYFETTAKSIIQSVQGLGNFFKVFCKKEPII